MRRCKREKAACTRIQDRLAGYPAVDHKVHIAADKQIAPACVRSVGHLGTQGMASPRQGGSNIGHTARKAGASDAPAAIQKGRCRVVTGWLSRSPTGAAPQERSREKSSPVSVTGPYRLLSNYR